MNSLAISVFFNNLLEIRFLRGRWNPGHRESGMRNGTEEGLPEGRPPFFEPVAEIRFLFGLPELLQLALKLLNLLPELIDLLLQAVSGSAAGRYLGLQTASGAVAG